MLSAQTQTPTQISNPKTLPKATEGPSLLADARLELELPDAVLAVLGTLSTPR